MLDLGALVLFGPFERRQRLQIVGAVIVPVPFECVETAIAFSFGGASPLGCIGPLLSNPPFKCNASGVCVLARFDENDPRSFKRRNKILQRPPVRPPLP
jgi:hypothetical protein